MAGSRPTGSQTVFREDKSRWCLKDGKLVWKRERVAAPHSTLNPCSVCKLPKAPCFDMCFFCAHANGRFVSTAVGVRPVRDCPRSDCGRTYPLDTVAGARPPYLKSVYCSYRCAFPSDPPPGLADPVPQVDPIPAFVELSDAVFPAAVPVSSAYGFDSTGVYGVRPPSPYHWIYSLIDSVFSTPS